MGAGALQGLLNGAIDLEIGVRVVTQRGWGKKVEERPSDAGS
jgi:hypothetical protein